MTKFHFRLATLLRLRQSVRDGCRVQLADAQRADVELQSHLNRLDTEQEQLQRECRAAAGPGPVDLRRLLEARQYSATLRARAPTCTNNAGPSRRDRSPPPGLDQRPTAKCEHWKRSARASRRPIDRQKIGRKANGSTKQPCKPQDPEEKW